MDLGHDTGSTGSLHNEVADLYNISFQCTISYFRYLEALIMRREAQAVSAMRASRGVIPQKKFAAFERVRNSSYGEVVFVRSSLPDPSLVRGY